MDCSVLLKEKCTSFVWQVFSNLKQTIVKFLKTTIVQCLLSARQIFFMAMSHPARSMTLQVSLCLNISIKQRSRYKWEISLWYPQAMLDARLFWALKMPRDLRQYNQYLHVKTRHIKKFIWTTFTTLKKDVCSFIRSVKDLL